MGEGMGSIRADWRGGETAPVWEYYSTFVLVSQDREEGFSLCFVQIGYEEGKKAKK